MLVLLQEEVQTHDKRDVPVPAVVGRSKGGAGGLAPMGGTGGRACRPLGMEAAPDRRGWRSFEGAARQSTAAHAEGWEARGGASPGGGVAPVPG